MFGEAIIGSLLGLGGSAVTAAVDYFKTKQSNGHELAMMQLQKQLADAEHEFQLHQADTMAQAESMKAAYAFQAGPTGTWVDAFSAFVRPGITCAFFGAYVMVKIATFYVGMTQGVGNTAGNMMLTLWTADDMVIFSSLLSFWFGNRSMVTKAVK